MRKIAVIYSGHAPHYRTFHEPKFAQYIDKLIYLPEFNETDLSVFDVLIVPSQLHSKLLLKAAPKIRELVVPFRIWFRQFIAKTSLISRCRGVTKEKPKVILEASLRRIDTASEE